MARIKPVNEREISSSLKEAFEKHVIEYDARITNMKATLGHSLSCFEIYMQWYVLYDEIKKILGERLAYLYAYSVSFASNCPLCSTFFRKIIIDAGENPENLQINPNEKKVLEFGSSIATSQGNISDKVYHSVAAMYDQQQMVVLIAFAGQMIATNVFSNVIQTDIDEYLSDYLPLTKTKFSHGRGSQK
jgi:hypothetical protein